MSGNSRKSNNLWRYCPLCGVGIAPAEPENVIREKDKAFHFSPCLFRIYKKVKNEFGAEVGTLPELREFLKTRFNVLADDDSRKSKEQMGTLQHLHQTIFGVPIDIGQIQLTPTSTSPISVSI